MTATKTEALGRWIANWNFAGTDLVTVRLLAK
jgi:hypothetical protein